LKISEETSPFSTTRQFFSTPKHEYFIPRLDTPQGEYMTLPAVITRQNEQFGDNEKTSCSKFKEFLPEKTSRLFGF